VTLWCDRLFTGGILFLILFTPFAFGSVQPWAYTTMEVAVFALLVVCMLKRAILARKHGAWSMEQEPIRNPKSEIRNFAIPLTLFGGLCVFQLLPLPPELLKIISPQTFEVYRQSLPGWPERLPFSDLLELQSAKREAQRAEGGGQGARREEQSAKGKEQSAKDREQGAASTEHANDAINASNAKNATNANDATNASNATPGSQLHAPRSLLAPPPNWRPPSISAGLTKIDLLKFIAFAALFFLVWRYPFAEPFENFELRTSNLGFFVLSPEQRFLRSVLFAILGTGLLVAALGFIERFSWNGSMLLSLAGYESGDTAANTIARASGPFINPDHFANYLSLIFPLALGCALFRTFMVNKSQEYGLRIFCGFTTFLLFSGILLSLSRGGWISALLGIVILVWLAPWHGAKSREGSGFQASQLPSGSPRARRQRSEVRDQPSAISHWPSAPPNHAPHPSRLTPNGIRRVGRLSLITVCILLIVSLFIAGTGGREQVDARLEETFRQDLGLVGRMAVWKDSVPMISDFPLFGVGLGAWPEHFLHYKSGPWSPRFFREAHNDYLEVLAETGFIGFGLLAAFFFGAGKRLVRGLRESSSKNLPLLAATLAALGGMALHSWLDFSLQIPANAFLFTVLLALGLRVAGSREHGAGSMERSARMLEGWEAGTPTQHDFVPEWSEVGDQQTGNLKFETRANSWPSALGALPSALSSMLRGLTPYAGVAAVAVLIIFAVTQDQGSYPFNFREMTSLADAQELLLAHPTHGPYHWALLTLAGKDAPLEWQLAHAKAAVWNEPANPYYRDLHAWALMTMERNEEGLKEMTRSVAESPSLDTHVYLSANHLPSLSEEEQAAVEEGFKQAIARSYPGALNGLSEFYAKLERFSDQAALYEETAQKESDIKKKTDLLIDAGLAYLRAEKQQAGSSEQGARGKGVRAGSTEQGEGSKAQGAKGKAQVGTGRREALGVRRNASNAERDNATNATNAMSATNATNATSLSGSELQAPSSMLHAAAERAFRAAVAAAPTDPKPYHHLVTGIYAARKDLDVARQLVADGIENGVPALPLYLSLAEAAQKAGIAEEIKTALKSAKAELQKMVKNEQNPYTLYIAFGDGARRARDRDEEIWALLQALELQPRSADVLSRLASLYSDKQNFDRAALYLDRITKINPDSADVYFNLAVAEEARYRFADASRAYARAIELAPGNESYRNRYEAFRERVAANTKDTR
jgi:tetratricopeptide (TPR) repeat protein